MKKPIRCIRQFLRKSYSSENLNRNKSLDDNNSFKKSQNSEISFDYCDDDLKNSSINNNSFNISSSTNKSIIHNQKVNNQIPKIPNYSFETNTNKNEKISIDYFSEDIPLDSLQIIKTEKEDSNLNNIISSNKRIQNSNNNIINNNSNLNKKLLEKIKEIQFLEQNLKEKNTIIEKQKNEIEKLTLELRKKNVKINI